MCMPKDYANIFKLEKEDLEKYKGKEFIDCMPGAANYAECLKTTILTKPTPYVLRLEDNFGMGKTHFSTRFTYFLRNCDIDAIYFSAWENDYIEQPFVSFSTEIIKYFQHRSINAELKAHLKNVSKSIYQLILNLLKSTTISVSAGLGIQAGCSVDLDKGIGAIETFVQSFIKNDDDLINFKKILKGFVESLPNKKLVIIVDELDRCRPDYAMKTLEIIKHFFDVEGLFIIIPTNERSLQKCVQALFGINETSNQDTENECYFNKFFNDKLNLYRPDYLKLVKTIIPEEKIQPLIENGKMTLNNKYNSLTTLQQKLAEFGEGFKLTMREMVNICNKAIYFCYNIDKKIDCEYLAFLLCSHGSRIKNKDCNIQSAHPFSINSKKNELLNFRVPEEVYKIGNVIYQQGFMQEYEIFRNRKFNSYKEFEDFYNFYSERPKNFNAYPIKKSPGIYVTQRYNFAPLEQYIETKKQEIDNYRNIWDSDDNDSALQKYYDDIVNIEPSIHADKLKLAEVKN